MGTNEFRKYFNNRKPSGAIALIIFGALFVLFGGLLEGSFLICSFIGLIMLAFGIHLIIKSNSKQSDAVVDDYCANQANEYFATKKLIVDSQDDSIIDAVCSSKYCFENLFSARMALRGKDNIWRSSIFEMSCIFLSEDMLYYYSKKISLITDEKSESQKSFQLQDVQLVP